jgi:hypothetical protein
MAHDGLDRAYLETAVGPDAGVKGDEGGGEVRIEESVLVPVAVVLVPVTAGVSDHRYPRHQTRIPNEAAASVGLLHDKLGVIVVDLPAE